MPVALESAPMDSRAPASAGICWMPVEPVPFVPAPGALSDGGIVMTREDREHVTPGSAPPFTSWRVAIIRLRWRE